MSKYYPLFWDWAQRRGLFYRIYINVFSIFLGIKLLPLRIYKDSIDFYYKGDTVIWLFPKNRKRGFKWVSVLSEGSFHTLKDLDKFWAEYWEYERTHEKDLTFDINNDIMKI